MISSLFNRTAAQRILNRIIGASVKRVEQLRQLRNTAIQLTYRIGKTLCSTFVSAKEFEQDFESHRRENASTVSVKQWPSGSYQNHFECRSQGSDRNHTVKLLGTCVLCSCEDFQKQIDSLRMSERAICKHIHATLNYLKYTSLEDYLDVKEREARESLFTF